MRSHAPHLKSTGLPLDSTDLPARYRRRFFRVGPALTLTLTAAFLSASGCQTQPQPQAQQKTPDNAAIRKKGSEEVLRICSLPPAERDAEIKKMQEQSGVVLYCGEQ